jgi:hypothetical protein
MAERVPLQIVIPFHQPISAGPEELDQAIARCYTPILDAIQARPDARIAVHFSGHLLDHVARAHEPLLQRLKEMAKAGQIEILGGLFYGGIPSILPEVDVRGQIEMGGQFWESYLGWTPTGYWLPELAWGAELPHLLDETGLDYGFASTSQLHLDGVEHRGLVTVQRGDERLRLFVLDEQLSSALPGRPVDEWIDALIDRGAKGDRVITVWVRAESLGLEPGTQAWCLERGWLNDWLSAVSGGRTEIEPLLPSQGLPRVKPAALSALRAGCAAEIGALTTGDAHPTFTDFVRLYPEVDALYRRMLRTSAKLAESISTMEEDALEDDWSDSLATAQRLVFAAQSHDVYWRGPHAGFTDPKLREAANARLIEASSMLDALVQGDEDWISTEEEDYDGDLVDEIFVSTAQLDAWIVPAHGGLVRTLDSRPKKRDLLDAGIRRKEVFHSSMAGAPREPQFAEAPVRGGNLARLNDVMPIIADAAGHRGIMTRVYDAGTTREELLAGNAKDLLPAATSWEVAHNAIDEEGDCSYKLELKASSAVPGIRPRQLSIVKTLNVPIDAPQLTLGLTAQLEGDEVLVATEVPVRLAGEVSRLLVNDVEASVSTGHFPDTDSLKLQADAGEMIELVFSQPVDLWLAPLDSSLRALDGYRAVSQGTLLVAVMRLADTLDATITIRVAESEG